VVVALPVLWATHRRFPLTSLLYWCIFVHAVVLMVGGAYTYARVPVGFLLQRLLHLHRNPYDKLGHFFQGCVPALVAREILIRGGYVAGRRMLQFVIVCIVWQSARCTNSSNGPPRWHLGKGPTSSSYTGRSVGHTIRHVLCAHRSRVGPGVSGACAGSPDCRDPNRWAMHARPSLPSVSFLGACTPAQ